ncbi:MAG: DoxX family protein [Xanthomonadales bacterium]|nr:DoxX family protein [Xanthomonadales bacterium]MCB1594573.1 DoxX family protein [Xanthomonadales bacterium]
MKILSNSLNLWTATTSRLNAAGTFLPQLFLRLILFWEFFWDAGLKKYKAGADGNWFATIQDSFPIPFNSFSSSFNWNMAMWGEIIGAFLILFGLFTRFAAFSLIVITVVATSAVHWPESWDSLGELWQGYVVTNKGEGNFKLPLLYVVMLFPLLFSGAGKLSLDNLLSNIKNNQNIGEKNYDFAMWGLIGLVICAVFIFLIPSIAIASLVFSALMFLLNFYLIPR